MEKLTVENRTTVGTKFWFKFNDQGITTIYQVNSLNKSLFMAL